MHSSRRRLHRRDRQSNDLIGSKSELLVVVVIVVVVAALVVKVPVVVVEVVVVVAGPTGPRWRSKLIADTLWNSGIAATVGRADELEARCAHRLAPCADTPANPSMGSAALLPDKGSSDM